jgi:hypothetical protein
MKHPVKPFGFGLEEGVYLEDANGEWICDFYYDDPDTNERICASDDVVDFCVGAINTALIQKLGE